MRFSAGSTSGCRGVVVLVIAEIKVVGAVLVDVDEPETIPEQLILVATD
jgi:hypothetical protein